MSYLISLNMMLYAKIYHIYYVISRTEHNIPSVVWLMRNWGGLSLHSTYSTTITTA